MYSDEKSLNIDMDILSLIKNPGVYNLETEKGIFIFSKDYDHKKIEISNYAYNNLIEKGTFSDLVKYLQSNNLADYIILCWSDNSEKHKVSLMLKETRRYLIPMNFENDNNDLIIVDKSIHHLDADRLSLAEFKDNICSKGLKFAAFNSEKYGNKLLPLFNTAEELHKLFPGEKYRICEISYKQALKISSGFCGIIYRPSKTDLVLDIHQAACFAAVDDFVTEITDYSIFTENEHSIQDKIEKLQTINNKTAEYENYFKGLFHDIAKLDKLYVALSPNEINMEKGKGCPIILGKDGQPAIYIFSDINIAKAWTQHYKNYRPDGTPLIGILDSENDFSSFFVIASRLDINLCIIDETAAFLGFTIKSFIDTNNLSSEIYLKMTQREADRILNTETGIVAVRFNQIPIAGAKQRINQNYIELKVR